MNNVTLIGRLTKDPEVKSTQSGKSSLGFTIAVERPTKDRTADFINCVAWEQTANIIGQYFVKGSRIGIVGAIQSRSWAGVDGKRVYVTEVLVNRVEFIDRKQDRERLQGDETPVSSIEMDEDIDVPFNL